MPELPEVETMRRGVLGAVGGTIREVAKPSSNYRPLPMTPSWKVFRQKCVGRQAVGVRRIGKRVLLDLDSSDSIIFQPKMAGLLVVANPPTDKHVRLVIELEGCPIERILYWDKRGLGSIHVWSPEEVALHLGEPHVGPDALEITAQEMKARFESTTRPIKPALLDQGLVAGVGNLYASELLHAAKIHPERSCRELTRSEWIRIHRAMQEILLRAIEQEGSTLGDGTYRNSVSDPGSYQAQHRVYARQDQDCLTCRRGKIVRTVQAQRSTFFCPVCQKSR